MQAVCGAIEQMRARLAREDAAAKCYIAGGAAHEIAPHLVRPVEVVDNLVLEGVLVLAADDPLMRIVVLLLLLANLTLFAYTKLDSVGGGEGVRLQRAGRSPTRSSC